MQVIQHRKKIAEIGLKPCVTYHFIERQVKSQYHEKKIPPLNIITNYNNHVNNKQLVIVIFLENSWGKLFSPS